MAIVGAVVGNVVADASSPSSESPALTANTADSSGTAAASTEPNMNTSSSSAQPRPMASEARSLVFCPISPAPAP